MNCKYLSTKKDQKPLNLHLFHLNFLDIIIIIIIIVSSLHCNLSLLPNQLWWINNFFYSNLEKINFRFFFIKYSWSLVVQKVISEFSWMVVRLQRRRGSLMRSWTWRAGEPLTRDTWPREEEYTVHAPWYTALEHLNNISVQNKLTNNNKKKSEGKIITDT